MSLELRSTSKKFYAVIHVKGKRKAFPLETEYKGTPPPNLRMRERGDVDFEVSRGRALEEEAQLKEELKKPRSEQRLRQRVYEVMTDSKFQAMKVSELFKISVESIRERPWSENYKRDVETIHRKFLAFLKSKYPNVGDAHEVTRVMAESFLKDYQSKSGCSNNRLNDIKASLQGLWTVGNELNLLDGNPFKGIPHQQDDSVTKEVFTPEQMESILKESEKDPDLRTVIILGLSTGMRLADCCALEWRSTDFKNRTVAVRCLKKNQGRTHIPFFGLLETLLLQAKQEQSNSVFVFPRVQRTYRNDRQYFSRAFSALLLRVGFTDDENPETSIRLTASDGCRRRPIRSFHALRTTWMTMALNGGISVETLKKVCGSADVEVIIEHYFKTEDNMVRSKLKATMPTFLGGEGIKDGRIAVATDQLLKLVDSLNGSN